MNISTELQDAINSYSDLNNKGQLNIRVISEIFEYLTKNKHDIESIKNGLLQLLSSPHMLDASFFSKGFYQSVVENSPIHEQIEFFYFL